MAKKKINLDVEEELIDSESVTSALGKAGRKCIRIQDEMINSKETLEAKLKEAKKATLDLMIKDGKKSIVIDGHVFSHRHKEAMDDVAIKKKKTKKESEED